MTTDSVTVVIGDEEATAVSVRSGPFGCAVALGAAIATTSAVVTMPDFRKRRTPSRCLPNRLWLVNDCADIDDLSSRQRSSCITGTSRRRDET
ncbi:hypothetical protein [Nocardia arthritidis]|uniref:hypothetical protein n=1 Tax=Nocardia arthritidis TaxID=228602 RepID=UPI0014713C72|nr:hypothetical protein [Nocardia arthritidis]